MLAPQPWFQPRGTPFSVLHRMKALSLLGHHVDLATYPVGQDVPIEGVTIYRAARIPFVRHVKVGPSKTKIFLDLFLIFLTIKLLRQKKYDLIHTHEEASFWGAFFAKRYKIPHLYDMHSSLPQQLINFKFTRFKPFLKIFDHLENYTIKSANAVITICPELQNYVEKNFPDKKSLLIENVADNSLVFPPDNTALQRLQNEYGLTGKTVILYYGTFEPYQGIDLLVQGAAPVVKKYGDKVRFVLVGGNEAQQQLYRDMASKTGFGDNFIFTGFVQPQVIPAFVQLADVLVSPRLKGNNSPLKIYSYLRSGKPIVATRHITHTQILNDTVAVLADASPEDFAAGIIAILDDEPRRNKMVQAARDLAERQYSYQEYLDKTAAILAMAWQDHKE